MTAGRPLAHQISSSGRRSDAWGWRPVRSGLSGESTSSWRRQRRAEPEERLAPGRQRAVGRPRLLVGDPRRPVGDGPEQQRLGVVGHGHRVGADRLEPERLDRRQAPRARPRRAARRSCPAGTVTSSWAYTSPRTPSAMSCSTERVHGVGTTMRSTPPRRSDAAAAHHSASDGSWSLPAAGLVGEVGGQAVPAVELPHVHDLGPAARWSRGWPTRRGRAGCAPRGRPGTSWPSCGACSGRGCAR